MKVINLSSWAGRNFFLADGALADVPESMAKARIMRGLMREAAADEIATLDLHTFPGVEAERDFALIPDAPLSRKKPKGSR